MTALPEFQLFRPQTAAEAATLSATHDNARYLAGGTDLMVNVRRGLEVPDTVIDLTSIAEMQEIGFVEGGRPGWRIGAGVTLAQLLAHDELMAALPIVGEAAGKIAATSHREVGTVGGNLCLDTRCVFYNQSDWWRAANDFCLKYNGDTCHVAKSGEQCFAAFSGDLAPALLVLGAEIEIAGPAGTRIMPLNDLYREDGMAHLTLCDHELLTRVMLPVQKNITGGYRKARVRQAIDFPLAGVAVAFAQSGGRLDWIKVALTGVSMKPVLVDGTDALTGMELDEMVADKILALIPKQIQPMTSTFTPPGYRRKVTANMTRRLVGELFAAVA